MLRIDHKKAQAATELAVFGAVIIFLLGTIVRSSLSNSYTQNQDFKAMCMAMLASWKGSTQGSVARSSASVLFVEDRLSPDFDKYGSLDRTPFIAMGSGTFSYMLLYPVDRADIDGSIDPAASNANLPIMDIYINGQHFPLTTASFVASKTLTPQPLSYCYNTYPPGCQQNQCLRSNREWVGGLTGSSSVTESSFVVPSVAPPITTITEPTCLNASPVDGQTVASAQRTCQMQSNACTVFTDLSRAGVFSSTSSGTLCAPTTKGTIGVSAPIQDSPQWNKSGKGFEDLYKASFPNNTTLSDDAYYSPYFSAILSMLQQINSGYKLFYSIVPNAGPNSTATQFSPVPPLNNCSKPPCPLAVLTSDIQVMDHTGTVGYWNGKDPSSGVDHTGDMMYDLQRMGDYSATGVENPITQFGAPINACPPATSIGAASAMRCYIGWQWAASAAVSVDSIGINTKNEQYPTMDIDGRLKPVTLYAISSSQASPPSVTVAYEDFQGGDIDQTWDVNTCGPKPGMQSTSQVMTYTQNGTYLLINEGKLYNPETGQVVRSANKKDNVDLVSRSIQLSNNTGRFCSTTSPITWGSLGHPIAQGGTNPVEACVDEKPCNCFVGDGGPLTATCGATIKETCFDSATNILFVRSRLQDLRGRFWMTDTSGQLKVH